LDAEPTRPDKGGYRQRLGRVRPNDDVVARHLDSETVLVHLGTNRIYTLNSTAARLWELLEEGHDRLEIERRMGAEFDVDGAELAEEIERALASLTAEGLVAPDG
jgi:hypothetical protein